MGRPRSSYFDKDGKIFEKAHIKYGLYF